MRVKLASSKPQSNVILRASSPPSNSSDCPPPPKEICCTRLMQNPAATLRVTMPTVMSLTSISIWSDGGSLQAGGNFAGAAVTIGDTQTVTGCMLAPASGNAAPAGFAAMSLICGADGNIVTISLPTAVRAASNSHVAVKVCAAGAHDGGMQDGSLWLQN